MSQTVRRFKRENTDDEAVYVLRRIDHKSYGLDERFRYNEAPPNGREFKVPANLPGMGDATAAAEIRGAAALTAAAIIGVTVVALIVRAIVHAANRPSYLRVRPGGILFLGLSTFAVPAVIAGAAWGLFRAVEFVVMILLKGLRNIPGLVRVLAPANPVRVLGRYPLGDDTGIP